MMKDVSLKGKTGISNERIVNKIQDFIWDDVLSRCVAQQDFFKINKGISGQRPSNMMTKQAALQLGLVTSTVTSGILIINLL